jgi:DNA-directed RNA polymerase
MIDSNIDYSLESNRRELQAEYEALSIEEGVQAYRRALAEQGNTAVTAGQELLKAAMRPMEEALVTWMGECSKGVPSKSASLYYFMDMLDPLTVTFTVARAVISSLHRAPSVSTEAIALCLDLEASINMEAISKASPHLGKRMAQKLADYVEGRNRAVFVRKGGERADVKMVQWDDGVRLRLGTLLIQMFADSTGLVSIDTIAKSRTQRVTIIRPTESCRKWLEVSHARCELLCPVFRPMLCPPRDWTSPFNGGYITPKMRRPLVKTRNRAYLTELKEWDMPNVYAAVNALQATSWAINEGIFEVARDLWEAGSTTAGLPSRGEVELPAKSWTEDETPEETILQTWKVAAARAYEANTKLSSKRIQVCQKLTMCEEQMERGNQFHFVYNMDWRGRLYPVSGALNPQGDDLAKALLRFNKGTPLGSEGAYWLAIHGANCFGVDKVDFDERIAWVEANYDRILEASNHPTNGTMWWAEADSPFLFLAFCFEWAKLQRHIEAGFEQETFRSHLACAWDGACNGLQNFSAMLKDELGGAATGLVPSHKPSDIYSEVARAAQTLIDGHAADPEHEQRAVALRWVGKMTRKLAKRNTMTVPYGVTRRGMQGQLFQELQKMVAEGELEKMEPADASYLASVNHEAIGEVVVAARRAMDWLMAAAKVAAKNQLPVHWTTPTGLLVLQSYRIAEGDRADFVVLGRRYQLVLQKTGDKLDTRKQAAGISPNFVHSLDAAHLMRTVLHCAADGMVDFAMIHDSYGCPAGQAGLLRDNLRAAFVEQYSTPVLENFRDELIRQLPEELAGEIPELPPVGSLDLAGVLQSEYFFA